MVKEINKSTSTITEEIKKLSIQIQEIPLLKQDVEDLKVAVKKKIQVFESRQIDHKLKVADLAKKIDSLQKENKSL